MQNNEIIKPAKYFSELEKSILLALVEKYKYVLECKKSDARTIVLKQRTWQALAHEYNSQPSVSLRDFKQLKKCWENIKARTKKIMAHERREKVKRSVSPLLSTHVLGKEKIANMLPDQLYFLQSPPEEEPEYHPDAAAQESFAVSNRQLCDDKKEFIHFPVCEGTSQPEPSCSAVRITASKNYRSKTSQEGALKKMHEEEHHQQMSILQLQLIQMNEMHVVTPKIRIYNYFPNWLCIFFHKSAHDSLPNTSGRGVICLSKQLGNMAMTRKWITVNQLTLSSKIDRI